MKYFIIVFSFLFVTLVSVGQNTFPPSGSVGIGTLGPNGKLQIVGNSGWDTSARMYLTNGSTDYGRTNFILTGRLQGGNDAWSFGSNGRNAIVFSSNNSVSGANVGGLGTEQFSLQHELASNSLGFLSQTQGANPIMVLKQSGYIGIGTINPQAKLHVSNGSIIASDPLYNGINVRLDGANIPVLKFSRDTDGSQIHYHNAFVGQFWNPVLGQYNLGIGTGLSDSGDQNATTNVLAITLNGNVAIGTTDPGSFKLAVNGKTWTTEVQVAVTRPPDYVFEPTYHLSSLDSIKTYIDKNKHLPEVPSAKEMEKNGVNLGEMNMLLLKKIEELTLYVIELKNEVNQLRQNQSTKK